MKIEGEPIEVNVVFGYFLHGFRYAVSNLFFFFFFALETAGPWYIFAVRIQHILTQTIVITMKDNSHTLIILLPKYARDCIKSEQINLPSPWHTLRTLGRTTLPFQLECVLR